MSALASRVIINETYDKLYGICDHDLAERVDPLSRVGFHPKEDVMSDSLEFQYMLRFKNLKVKDAFGVDFPTFLKQSRASADEMLRLCAIDLTKPNPNSVLNDLDKELNR